MQQRFWFQAVDKNGKTVNGSVYAETKDKASDKLRHENFAVLSLKEYDENDEAVASGLIVFEFDALSPDGRHVHGTIEGTDDYTAYKKLVLEFKFEVLSLYPNDISMPAKTQAKMKGVSQEIKDKFAEDNDAIKKQKVQEKKAAKDEKEEREYTALIKKKEEEVLFVRQQVEQILSEVQDLLDKNDQFLDPDKKRSIKERLDLLSRLRQSNAIGHLKNLTQKIFEQIQDDAFFLSTVNLTEEELIARKGEFSKLGSSLEKRFDRGLISLQEALAKIDTEKITEIVKDIKIIETTESITFFSFVSLLGFALLFWLYVGLLWVMDFDRQQASYFLGSSTLWFVTSFSAIIVIFLEFFRLHKVGDLTNRQKFIYAIGGSAMLLFFLFQFPAIFFWTR